MDYVEGYGPCGATRGFLAAMTISNRHDMLDRGQRTRSWECIVTKSEIIVYFG